MTQVGQARIGVKRVVRITASVLLSALWIVGCGESPELQPEQSVAASGAAIREAVTSYAARNLTQLEELSAVRNMVIPDPFTDIIQATAAFDWVTASNTFAETWGNRTWWKESGVDPAAAAELWTPVHETYWAFSSVRNWDADLLMRYVDGVLESLPQDAVLFAGTDSSRFIIGAFQHSKGRPDIKIISPNQLADRIYLQYVVARYGAVLSIPGPQRLQELAGQYATQHGRSEAGELDTLPPGDNTSASSGGLWYCNAMLSQQIFDQNKHEYPFCFAQGYAFPWMLRFLQPSGLLMKLSDIPVSDLSDELVERNDALWDGLVDELLGHPAFPACRVAQVTFSKLRCAHGGLYAFHRRDRLAEQAFQQAIRLDPSNQEAVFRLAKLYAQTDRFDQAESLASQYESQYGHTPQVNRLMSALRETKRFQERQEELEEMLETGKMELRPALELTEIYRIRDNKQRFEHMVRTILTKSAVPPPPFWSLAKICERAGRTDLLLTCIQARLEEHEDEPWTWTNLAAAYVLAKQQDKALATLRKAVDLHGKEIRKDLKEDPRFEAIRDREGFRALLSVDADKP